MVVDGVPYPVSVSLHRHDPWVGIFSAVPSKQGHHVRLRRPRLAQSTQIAEMAFSISIVSYRTNHSERAVSTRIKEASEYLSINQPLTENFVFSEPSIGSETYNEDNIFCSGAGGRETKQYSMRLSICHCVFLDLHLPSPPRPLSSHLNPAAYFPARFSPPPSRNCSCCCFLVIKRPSL